MLRVGLVGCGKSAEMHVGAIRRYANAKLLGLCDTEPLMAEQLAARYGIPKCYSQFDEMLACESPDVVHVATPPQSHFSLAVEALESGCHVVVEKPLGVDLQEAEQLIAKAERCSRKLTVAYTYYFDPIARMLRVLAGNGVMGDPVHLESHMGYDLNGSFGIAMLADPDHWVHELPGKLFQNVLDHLVNKVTEFVPDPNPVIRAYSWQIAEENGEDGTGGVPDELRVMMIGGKVSAYLTLSSHARPIRHLLTFRGSRNSARLDFNRGTITFERDPHLPGVLGRLASPFSEGWQLFREGAKNVLRFARSDYHFYSGFNYLVSQFYDSVLNDLPVPISYNEVLRNAAIIDEIMQQVRCTPEYVS